MLNWRQSAVYAAQAQVFFSSVIFLLFKKENWKILIPFSGSWCKNTSVTPHQLVLTILTQTALIQLLAKERFFLDWCFSYYKLRQSRKYCRKTVIKSSSPKCQIPSRFRATTVGAETKVKKRDKSLLSSSTLGTTDKDNTVKKEKKRSCHPAIPTPISSQFQQHKSHFPAHHPAVPLITTFRLPLSQLFKRPGGQPLLNSPNRGRLTHRCRLQAVEKPQGRVTDRLQACFKSLNSSIKRRKWGNQTGREQIQTAKSLLD